MVCAQCGKENPEGARFCAFCGGVPHAPKSTPVKAVPVRATTSIPVARPSPSRLPLIAAVSSIVVVAGGLALVTSRFGPVRGAISSLSGRNPRGGTEVARVDPGSIPGVSGMPPPLAGGPQGSGAGAPGGVQGTAPASGLPGGTPGSTAPGVAAGPKVVGGGPGVPGNVPGSVAANAPAGSITSAGAPGAAAGAAVSGTAPGGVALGVPLTSARPGQGPAGAGVVAGSSGSAPSGRAVTGATPGAVPQGKPVTGGTPGATPAAPAVTAGEAGNVPAGASVAAGKPGSPAAGNSVTATPPASAPSGRAVIGTPPVPTPPAPSVAAGKPGGTPAGRGVQSGQPQTVTPQRVQPQRPSGPSEQEKNLVAEYLRRLERIQIQDNQLNQQIGSLGGGWLGTASGLQGLEDPGQFLQQYGNITQGFARVALAKQNVGNLFLNTCGPIARVCPPVQNLHNWYIRYFQDWVQATQMLTMALRTHNLGAAMQVQGLLGRAETTQQQCQREEDRLRDRYDLPLSPFGPR